MELALVTGRGPELVTSLEGRRPLARDEDVVVSGFRDAAHAGEEGSQPLAPTIRAMDQWSVREQGVERAARTALAHLERMVGSNAAADAEPGVGDRVAVHIQPKVDGPHAERH
jgi:hypothetical protein